MYFNIVITMNDIIFLLGMVPISLVFAVMFIDWFKDKDRYK